VKIALVTCLEKPEGTFDDQLLKAALVKAGHTADFRVWNGATDWPSYDTCLLRSTWDYHRNLKKFLHWMHSVSKNLRVLNGLDVVRWNADKSYLCELGKAGLSVVPTKVFTDASEAIKTISKQIETGRVVIKPAVSATAELTYKIESDKDLGKLVKAILDRSGLVLQPYVESIEEHGELSLVYFMISGKIRYSHSVLKKAKRGDFRVQEEFGGSVEKANPPAEAMRLAERALEAVSHKWSYARVDLVDWTTQPRVGELELIEPELFFRLHPEAADSMIQALT
jgi:glutathione synthase/RimK-type ligase-like ATP-grasp enzyme